jgi:tryptophan 2,3-dioxygenase
MAGIWARSGSVSAQTPLTDEHDEMMFIIIHQASRALAEALPA